MSAIFGVVRFDGRDVSRRDLDRMADAMRYRGPDGCACATDGPVGLGHCLRRVNGEDASDSQPLRDRDANLTLVGDVRLDNRDVLGAAFDLGTTALGDLPDSALVLRAYCKWGDACAEHLLGDFAFAIWDGRARRLLLARDHMGQRYVHYHCSPRGFFFATDIKGLWASAEVPQVLLDSQIGAMLAGARPTGEGVTLFKDIVGLTGGTSVSVAADGAVVPRRYWEPRADPAHEGRDEPYYVEAYRHVLGEAVSCRIRRAVRSPGLVFSGGYDSTAIAGLAGPVLARAGRKMVAAASVMPADYRGTIRHARRWVEMCARDMPHLDVRYVTREGMSMLSGLEQAFFDADGPAGAYHFVITELLSTLASAGAQVIMDGHGGDYTLHPRGQGALAYFLATGQLRRCYAELRGHLRLADPSVWRALKNELVLPLMPARLLASWRRARRRASPLWRARVINPTFARRLFADRELDSNGLRELPASHVDMRGRMASVLRRVAGAAGPSVAVAAARHGLELTRPFHDKRVVELGLAIPPGLYVKNGRNRYLACVALKDVYPPEFQRRWRRNDDEIPDFQRMVKSIEPELLADIARMERSGRLAEYVDFQQVRALLAARGPDDHNSGWELETQRAVLGFVVARYVEWFRRDNR